MFSQYPGQRLPVKTSRSSDQNHDDTHKRYDSISKSQKDLWEFYDRELIPPIISDVIKNKSLTLAKLYHRLAMLRAKCEALKSALPANIKREELISLAKSIIALENAKNFGLFQLGNSVEMQPTSVETWGEKVAALILERKNKNDIGTVALSGFGFNRLVHPTGSILFRLEPTFQALLTATNLFDYIKLAARLMFELSNYPPITRGSAAVNTWIIDKIGVEKFNLTASIRPLLYDWTAFLETPDQYTAFYVISATTEYVKSIKAISDTPEFKDFHAELLNVMQKDPNNRVNMNERKKTWIKLKSLIEAALKRGGISDNETQRLHEIMTGDISFKLPSERVLELIRKLKPFNDNEDPKLLEDAVKSLPEDDQHFLKEICELDVLLSSRHLLSYGDLAKEEQLNERWTDFALLNTDPLLVEKLRKHFSISPYDPFYVESTTVDQGIRRNDVKMYGHVEVNDTPLSNELTYLFDEDCRDTVAKDALKTALQSANVHWQDFNNLTMDQIKILTSRAAIMLYNNPYLNIQVKDLLDDSVEKIQTKIFIYIAKYYCHEDIKVNPATDVINLLISQPDLFLVEGIKIAALIASSDEEIKRNILKAYLMTYFQEPDSTHLVERINVADLDSCLRNIGELAKRYQPLVTTRERLDSDGFKAGVLMQLDSMGDILKNWHSTEYRKKYFDAAEKMLPPHNIKPSP